MVSSASRSPRTLVYFPYFLHGRVDARARCGEVLRIHGRPHRETCMERQEPGFGDGGQLRRLLISKNMYPVRSPLSSEKYAASGLSSSSIR